MLKGAFAGLPRSSRFWMLVAFLAISFFTGGSARSDVVSLAVLRPVSVVMLGAGLCSLRLHHMRTHKWLLILASLVILLVALQLAPLPDIFRASLSGNNLINAVAMNANSTDMMRPLAIAPTMTLNAFFALIGPLAVLIFCVQLSLDERFVLLPVVLVLALFSGFLGFLQAVGNSGSGLYFYQITNVDAAVGLFANRNHQATLLALLFPMLAVYASANIRSQGQIRIKGVLSLAAAAILVPLMLVTGSRTGLLIGVIGIISGLILYKAPEKIGGKTVQKSRISPFLIIGGLAVVALGALSIVFSRAEAVQRLAGLNQNQDLRFQIWGPILNLTPHFLPSGSGLGTFPIAYQVYESNAQLGPAIVNQAHNDWLDLVLTSGCAGIVLIIVAGIGFGRLAWTALRSPMKAGSRVQLSRLGVVTTFLVVLAALVDYAVRTPIMAMIFIICVVWSRSALEVRSSQHKVATSL